MNTIWFQQRSLCTAGCKTYNQPHHNIAADKILSIFIYVYGVKKRSTKSVRIKNLQIFLGILFFRSSSSSYTPASASPSLPLLNHTYVIRLDRLTIIQHTYVCMRCVCTQKTQYKYKYYIKIYASRSFSARKLYTRYATAAAKKTRARAHRTTRIQYYVQWRQNRFLLKWNCIL